MSTRSSRDPTDSSTPPPSQTSGFLPQSRPASAPATPSNSTLVENASHSSSVPSQQQQQEKDRTVNTFHTEKEDRRRDAALEPDSSASSTEAEEEPGSERSLHRREQEGSSRSHNGSEENENASDFPDSDPSFVPTVRRTQAGVAAPRIALLGNLDNHVLPVSTAVESSKSNGSVYSPKSVASPTQPFPTYDEKDPTYSRLLDPSVPSAYSPANSFARSIGLGAGSPRGGSISSRLGTPTNSQYGDNILFTNGSVLWTSSRNEGGSVLGGSERGGGGLGAEMPVTLPLTRDQIRLTRRLAFLRKYYLVMHVAYIVSLVLLGSLVFYSAEEDLPYVDAFYVATSTVCNCGLQTVDVGSWLFFSNSFRHVLMIGGGIVWTSAYQPLLRLFMLYTTWRVFERRPHDVPAECALRTAKRIYAERLWRTSLICLVTSLLYFSLIILGVTLLMWLLNTSNLKFMDVLFMSVASFHTSIFLSMEQYVNDPAVVFFVTFACACGFTLYPILLRPFLYIEWVVFRFFARLYLRRSRPLTSRKESIFEVIGEDSPLMANSPSHRTDNLFRDADTRITHHKLLNPWDHAFYDILVSKTPGVFHQFLFTRNETYYLLFAWVSITLAQAAPFWFQQWGDGGLLRSFHPGYRLFLSLCQAAVVRYAAASFVELKLYSNAHIAITILAMFLPALPISTDRTYRKWKQMFRTSLVRLFTSRLFWLFAAMMAVMFAEEKQVFDRVIDTRFDVMTRTLFETISAYSGCGFSLSLDGTSYSFSGSLGPFSKFVFTLVMLGGRHRTVDLGIDLGFSALEEEAKTDKAVREGKNTLRRGYAESAAASRSAGIRNYSQLRSMVVNHEVQLERENAAE